MKYLLPMSLTLFISLANASDNEVIFEVGEGVSKTGLEVAKRVIREAGCSVAIEKSQVPKLVIVRINGKKGYFESTMGAAHFALDYCKPNRSK